MFIETQDTNLVNVGAIQVLAKRLSGWEVPCYFRTAQLLSAWAG